MRFDNNKSNGANNFMKQQGSIMPADGNLIDQIVQVAVRTTIETMGHISMGASVALPKKLGTVTVSGDEGASAPNKAPLSSGPRTRKARKNLTPPDGPQLVVEAAEVFCVSARSADWSNQALAALRGIAKFEPELGLVRRSHIVARLAHSTSKQHQRSMFGYIKAFFAEFKRSGWWLGPNPTDGINIVDVPVATTRGRCTAAR